MFVTYILALGTLGSFWVGTPRPRHLVSPPPFPLIATTAFCYQPTPTENFRLPQCIGGVKKGKGGEQENNEDIELGARNIELGAYF